MVDEKLWDLKHLLKNYPAFKEWGVRWLIRHRRIPMVKIGRRIYFDPSEITLWIQKNKISEIGGEK